MLYKWNSLHKNDSLCGRRLSNQKTMYLSKALFSQDPDNLQLHCFQGWAHRSFFFPLDQLCKTMQTVQAAPE